MTAENSDCLLTADGHTSRACPLALEIFRHFRVDVLTLPSLMSDICQFFDVGLTGVLKRALKSHLQRLARTIRHTDFPNETVKTRWLLVNALIDAWYQILTRDLCRTASETCGLFPFSLDHLLRSSSIIDAQAAVRVLGPQFPRDLMNINAQVVMEPIKIEEINRLLHSNHSDSSMRFDANLDYRTVVHRIVYRDDLGTTFHTNPPPLRMRSNDDYARNCSIGVHTFP
jgi:hypothetical protein